ncbi:TIGR03089 family protein [Streptomyces somaliensis]|uniref:TIGR03089 family protein n=1 Tax=Streptomyces somaliensis TaxID=78355 RepID=UPI0020CD697B|nr:TIGR03089 family protein [Streptomyces somaliensis]MCP9944014.1 TIGR03089 family protein [Streptomyces somaliensis]
MNASDRTPADLLRSALDADPARPLVTYYDDATGERVELSVATFANWVAKTANLLRDGLCAEPGERVALLLPAHWQTAVWLLACASAGVVADLDGDPAGADHVVAGPDRLDEGLACAGGRLALSLAPLGRRFPAPPAGYEDYAVEVPGQGDRFVPYAPVDPGAPALAVARARRRPYGADRRRARRPGARGRRPARPRARVPAAVRAGLGPLGRRGRGAVRAAGRGGLGRPLPPPGPPGARGAGRADRERARHPPGRRRLTPPGAARRGPARPGAARRGPARAAVHPSGGPRAGSAGYRGPARYIIGGTPHRAQTSARGRPTLRAGAARTPPTPSKDGLTT